MLQYTAVKILHIYILNPYKNLSMVETQKKTYLLLHSRAPFARTHTRKWISEKYVSLRMELLTKIPNSIFLQENQERECFITRPFPFLTITTKDPFRLLLNWCRKAEDLPPTWHLCLRKLPVLERFPMRYGFFPLILYFFPLGKS